MGKRWVMLTVVLASAVAAGIYLWPRQLTPAPVSGQAPMPAADSRARPEPRPGSARAPLAAGAPALPLGQDELVSYLQARYGANIHEPYVQLRMIEELMRHFQNQSPENWQEALLAALRAAFPALYEELAKRFQGRVAYGDWMEENRSRLQGLDPKERQELIWDERKRLFGEEAAERIWAAERKNDAVADALSAIDSSEGATISDKLAMYKDALEGVYQEDVDAYMQRHQHEAMNRFLGLVSVQASLGAMSADERAKSLREIRQGMGLDEQALSRWDTLDRERDARWEQGLAYMNERKMLTERYAGAELEDKLAALRARYFGGEADIIAQEEASGFFRFDRPRRWGQN